MVCKTSRHSAYLYVCNACRLKDSSCSLLSGKPGSASDTSVLCKSTFQLCRGCHRKKHSYYQKYICSVIIKTISVHVLSLLMISQHCSRLHLISSEERRCVHTFLSLQLDLCQYQNIFSAGNMNPFSVRICRDHSSRCC